MAVYDVEIRVTKIYQIEGIRARNEEAAIAKAYKRLEKNPEKYFDDSDTEADADLQTYGCLKIRWDDNDSNDKQS